MAAVLQLSANRFRSMVDRLVGLAPAELMQSMGARNLARAVVAVLQGLSSVTVTLSPNEYRSTIAALTVLLKP